MSPNSFGSRATLRVGETSYRIHRLDAAAGSGDLPFCLKVLLENLLRTEDGLNVTADHISALAEWDPAAEPATEIQFSPARVLLQDLTGVPAVVDLATMREAMAELGGDAARINPLIPAELVIDHSVIADVFGRPDAFERNVEFEFQRNEERYALPALGPGGAAPVQGGAAGHRHRAPGQHRVPGPGGHDAGRAGDGSAGRLPGHLPRHRLAHHHAERPRRPRLGRRRHRGRGGHAGPAGLDADPAGGRVPADRGAAGRRDRHRPGADDHRAAAQARRGRQVRRVLRRGRGRRAGGQPGHDRQHEPGVRLHLRDLPDRRRDPQPTCG